MSLGKPTGFAAASLGTVSARPRRRARTFGTSFLMIGLGVVLLAAATLVAASRQSDRAVAPPFSNAQPRIDPMELTLKAGPLPTMQVAEPF